MNKISDIELITKPKQIIENFYNRSGKSINSSSFSIIIDDIKNFKLLTDVQIIQLESFTDIEKIEIIKTYNNLFTSIKNVV